MIIKKFWKNKKVFITGHTGFKGAWLNLLLEELEAQTFGYALKPFTNPSLYQSIKKNNEIHGQIADIRNFPKLKLAIKKFQPDIIFHLAAQPLVRKSYASPVETFETNIQGTINILEALKEINNHFCFINVTTDKCYLNDNLNKPFKESDALGGFDPYSASKASSEIVTNSYYQSFFKNNKIGIATARAGNIIGGGDWSEDRIVPDIIRSIGRKKNLKVRNPHATRPWQHVFDALNGYLLLAQKLYLKPYQFSGPWNFGPNPQSIKSVSQMVKSFQKYFEFSVDIQKSSPKNLYEAAYLRLNSNKAKEALQWSPLFTFENSIENIANWYQGYFLKQSIYNICINDIKRYLNN